MAKNKNKPKKDITESRPAKKNLKLSKPVNKEPAALTKYRDSLVEAKHKGDKLQEKLLEKIIKNIENRNP